jgi:hypothetical protein
MKEKLLLAILIIIIAVASCNRNLKENTEPEAGSLSRFKIAIDGRLQIVENYVPKRCKTKAAKIWKPVSGNSNLHL